MAINDKLIAIKRLGMADLSQLTWTLGANDVWTSSAISDCKAADDPYVPANFLAEKYGNRKGYFQVYEEGDIAIDQDMKVLVKNGSTTESPTGRIIYELDTYKEYEMDTLPRGAFEWYGVKNGAEVRIETLPCYVSGQGTDTLVVDAMYGENISIILRVRSDNGSLSPDKSFRMIAWRIPDVDTNVLSKNGGAVRSNSTTMTFGTIQNVLGTVLSDEKKRENMRFNWKTRKSTVTQVVDRGWGQELTLHAQELFNVKGSGGAALANVSVYPEVYVLGAYEEVMDNGEVVTDSGETLFDRTL